MAKIGLNTWENHIWRSTSNIKYHFAPAVLLYNTGIRALEERGCAPCYQYQYTPRSQHMYTDIQVITPFKISYPTAAYVKSHIRSCLMGWWRPTSRSMFERHFPEYFSTYCGHYLHYPFTTEQKDTGDVRERGFDWAPLVEFRSLCVEIDPSDVARLVYVWFKMIKILRNLRCMSVSLLQEYKSDYALNYFSPDARSAQIDEWRIQNRGNKTFSTEKGLNDACKFFESQSTNYNYLNL